MLLAPPLLPSTEPARASAEAQRAARRFASREAALAAGAVVATPAPRAAVAAAAVRPPLPSLAVFGAGGRVGRAAVALAEERGGRVQAVGRQELDLARASVEEIAELLSGCSAEAVVWCAASLANADAVDRDGLVRVSEAAVRAGCVRRLALCSASGLAHPRSPVFLANDLGTGSMSAKAAGEAAMRATLGATNANATSYTIVRAGTLSIEPPLGVAALELTTGDEWEGRVSVVDMAEVLLESLLSPACANASFSLYYRPARGVASEPFAVLPRLGGPSATERQPGWGDTYPELFAALSHDAA